MRIDKLGGVRRHTRGKITSSGHFWIFCSAANNQYWKFGNLRSVFRNLYRSVFYDSTIRQGIVVLLMTNVPEVRNSWRRIPLHPKNFLLEYCSDWLWWRFKCFKDCAKWTLATKSIPVKKPSGFSGSLLFQRTSKKFPTCTDLSRF